MRFSIILLLLICLLGSSSLNAQDEHYTDGYVIKMSGDTLFGRLKIFDATTSGIKLKFKDENGELVKIKNKKVAAYKRGDDLYVRKSYERPISISSMKGYMRLLAEGRVKLFKFNYVSNNGGFMTYGSDYYLERYDHLYLVTKLGFKNDMIKFFIDNQALVERIKSKEFRYDDLEELVRIYNGEE